jgi:hypothetical protein
MKLSIFLFAAFAAHVNAETFGNKMCVYFSASSEPARCFRKLSDCENHLEKLSASESIRDATCKAR